MSEPTEKTTKSADPQDIKESPKLANSQNIKESPKPANSQNIKESPKPANSQNIKESPKLANSQNIKESPKPANLQEVKESPKPTSSQDIKENPKPTSSQDIKENPIKVYAVVSQVGFSVIIPLLIFIWGGSVLVEKLSLPSWVMLLCVLIGIITMISSTGTYLMKLISRYDKDDRSKYKMVSDRRDHDYYDEHGRR